MPKGIPKDITEAKRVNVYLRPPQLKTRKLISNYSAFVQIATDNAADIMAWAILKKVDPKKYHPLHQLDEPGLVDEFNKKFPADPLIPKGKKWPKNSQKLPDVLF